MILLGQLLHLAHITHIINKYWNSKMELEVYSNLVSFVQHSKKIIFIASVVSQIDIAIIGLLSSQLSAFLAIRWLLDHKQFEKIKIQIFILKFLHHIIHFHPQLLMLIKIHRIGLTLMYDFIMFNRRYPWFYNLRFFNRGFITFGFLTCGFITFAFLTLVL